MVGEFRALAPERRPISLQRWGVKRVAYIVALDRGGVRRQRRPRLALAVGTDGDSYADLRHRERDDPHGAGRADGYLAAVHRLATGRLGTRWCERRRRPRRSGSTPIWEANGPSKRPCARQTTARWPTPRSSQRRGRDATVRAARTTATEPAEYPLLLVRRRMRGLPVLVRR